MQLQLGIEDLAALDPLRLAFDAISDLTDEEARSVIFNHTIFNNSILKLMA